MGRRDRTARPTDAALANPVEMVAAHLSAFAGEVDAHRAGTLAAHTAAVLIRERRQGGLVDGSGGWDALSSTTGGRGHARHPARPRTPPTEHAALAGGRAGPRWACRLAFGRSINHSASFQSSAS